MHALDLPVNGWYATADGPIYADKGIDVPNETVASQAYVVPPVEGMAAVPATVYDDPQDGGLVAWLQVAGSFFLFFNSW